MANDYYQATGNPGTRASGSSSTMRAEFADIEAAFDKMPQITGNAGKAVVVNAGATGLGLTAGALALAGNFATVGAFALTLTVTGATNVTLPTVGTLATLAGAETLTNKTLTSPVLVAPQLGTPVSGNLANCTGLPISTGVSGLAAGVATFLGAPSSANLAAAMTDKTGTGALVFGTSPTLTAPNLGTPSAGNLANCTNLPIGGGTTGTLSVGRGGTGTSTAFGPGQLVFAGASGVYNASGNLAWDNANNVLAVNGYLGVAVTPNATWTARIQTPGDAVLTSNVSTMAWNAYYDGAFRTSSTGYPFYIRTNGSGAVEFYGGPSTTAGASFSAVLLANWNLATGSLGLGAAATGRRLSVFGAANGEVASQFTNTDAGASAASVIYADLSQTPNGYIALSVARNAGNPFARLMAGAAITGGILYDAGGGSGHYFYVSGANRLSLTTQLSTTVPISSSTTSANLFNNLSLQGDGAAGYVRTTNVGPLNLGVNGATQLSILTNGDVYGTGRLGVGVSPIGNWSATIQTSGDIVMKPSVSALQINSYYDGAWRYANNGWPATFRTDGTGFLQLLGGAQNTGGAGAAYSPITVASFDLANQRFGIGGNPSRALDVIGGVNGAVEARIANGSTGASAYSGIIFDLSSIGNAYGFLGIYNNGSSRYMQMAQGAAVTGPLYVSAQTQVMLQVAGSTRLTVDSAAVTFSGVYLNSTSTSANFFNNLLLQGDGASGYIRTTNNGNLYLGANGANSVAVHSTNQYLYPLTDNFTQSGASGNRWSQVHSLDYYVWGTSSGYTRINAQAVAANNVVVLPSNSGTLLIGGTQVTASLGSNVALNNTSVYFDGPAISLGAGTWFVSGSVTAFAPSGGRVDCKLWDGTNVLSEGSIAVSSGQNSGHLSGYITLGSTTTVKISAKATATDAQLVYSPGGAGKGCTITAFRVA